MSEKEVGETQRNDAGTARVEKSSISAAWAQTNDKIKLHGYGGAGRGQGGIREPCRSICLKTGEIHDQKVTSSSSLIDVHLQLVLCVALGSSGAPPAAQLCAVQGECSRSDQRSVLALPGEGLELQGHTEATKHRDCGGCTVIHSCCF